MSDRDQSYRNHPELTPYVSHERYENPKEDFKTIAKKIDELVEPSRVYRVADVGCGNGELLYYLKKLYPEWELFGFDHTPEFVKTAEAYPGLTGVTFNVMDFADIKGNFDIVICTCFLSLFKDISEPLEHLLELCEEDGFVFATGLFNPHDIEVRVEFCDNSREETRGEWRTDFNRHSQNSIKRLLQGKVKNIEFEQCEYNIEIQKNPEHEINVWTFKDENGSTFLINGVWQITNQTLLTIHK